MERGLKKVRVKYLCAERPEEGTCEIYVQKGLKKVHVKIVKHFHAEGRQKRTCAERTKESMQAWHDQLFSVLKFPILIRCQKRISTAWV